MGAKANAPAIAGAAPSPATGTNPDGSRVVATAPTPGTQPPQSATMMQQMMQSMQPMLLQQPSLPQQPVLNGTAAPSSSSAVSSPTQQELVETGPTPQQPDDATSKDSGDSYAHAA